MLSRRMLGLKVIVSQLSPAGGPPIGGLEFEALPAPGWTVVYWALADDQ